MLIADLIQTIMCVLVVIINLMLQRTIQLRIRAQVQKRHNKQEKNLSDLFLMIGSQIFPISREQNTEIKYIYTSIPKNQQVHIIRQPLNTKVCTQIFSMMSGSSILIKKWKQLTEFLNIIDFFQIQILKKSIQDQIQNCFHELEIFPTLELAYQFSLHQLFKLCIENLIEEQFQQINYNRFDFIQCDFTLFQIILRRHHKMKVSQQIQGLTPDMVEQVIKLYCSTNKYNQETLNKLLDKYVRSLRNNDFLQLDGLVNKKVLKSEIYDNDTTRGSNFEEAKVEKKKGRQRKFSCEVQSVKNNWFKFGGDSIKQKKPKKQLKHLKTLNSVDNDDLNSENQQKSDANNEQNENEIVRISGLINQYYTEFKLHRQSTKQDDSDLLPKTARFNNSLNLAQNYEQSQEQGLEIKP